MKSKGEIIAEKQILANQSLYVAKRALDDIETILDDEVSIKDLLAVYNLAIKAHRDLSADLLELSKTEDSQEEMELAKDYSTKVSELINKLKK